MNKIKANCPNIINFFIFHKKNSEQIQKLNEFIKISSNFIFIKPNF